MEIVFEHGDSAAQRELAHCLVQLGVARMAEQVSDDGERREAAATLVENALAADEAVARGLRGTEAAADERLAFDVEYGRRQAAMALFVEMAGRGLLTCTRQRLIGWLARHTNLGSESAVKQLFYRCQRMQYGR